MSGVCGESHGVSGFPFIAHCVLLEGHSGQHQDVDGSKWHSADQIEDVIYRVKNYLLAQSCLSGVDHEILHTVASSAVDDGEDQHLTRSDLATLIRIAQDLLKVSRML